jgi:hypothetical protein
MGRRIQAGRNLLGIDLSEKEIQNQILEYLYNRGVFCWRQNTVGVYDEKRGCYIRNNSRYVIRGVSDILGVLPNGRILAIEVKSRKGKVSPDQEAFLKNVLLKGGVAILARSLEDVIAELDYLVFDDV